MGLDLRFWEADTVTEDEWEDWDNKAVEEEVCEESDADCGGYERSG